MQKERSSFRDDSGFVFYSGDSIFRTVSKSFQSDFDTADSSGLYTSLISEGHLIPHREVPSDQWPNLIGDANGVYKILQPEKISFVSYPYEWSFSQLKDAALLTLDIQLKALEKGLSLKDASAYNVQFRNGRPVFIDTLSFEKYNEGEPWVAYRQFCKHFLAPLALSALVDPEFRKLSQLYIDGVPLALASKLLPWKTRLSPFYQLHLHYHAKLENKFSGDGEVVKGKTLKLDKNKLVAIIQHLKSGISSLELRSGKTEWGDYYQECSYSSESLDHKRSLVSAWASEMKPAITFDLGCNTGVFSEAVIPHSKQVVSFDLDHLAIERLYHRTKDSSLPILPLVMDLSQPSPAIGWANEERNSLTGRSKADLVLALALIHHLSIGNNLPFEKVVSFFSAISPSLIIEFVPKDDVQSQRLLVTRKDVFGWYNQENFEKSFSSAYHIQKKETIKGTGRTLYLMTKK